MMNLLSMSKLKGKTTGGKYCGILQKKITASATEIIEKAKYTLNALLLKNQAGKKAKNKLNGMAQSMLKLSPVTLCRDKNHKKKIKHPTEPVKVSKIRLINTIGFLRFLISTNPMNNDTINKNHTTRDGLICSSSVCLSNDITV